MPTYEVRPATGLIESYWWRETAEEVAAEMDAAGHGPTEVYEMTAAGRIRIR